MLRGPAEHVPFWKASETKEMDGLNSRGCIKRVHRRDLIDDVDKVFQGIQTFKEGTPITPDLLYINPQTSSLILLLPHGFLVPREQEDTQTVDVVSLMARIKQETY